MPIPEDERNAIKAAIEASGIKLRHLILGPDGRTPVITDTAGFLEWAVDRGEEHSAVHVADDKIEDIRVSTVFLAPIVSSYDHSLAAQPFETMVFEDGKDVGMTRRYLTWDEAEIGHREILDEVRALLERRSTPTL